MRIQKIRKLLFLPFTMFFFFESVFANELLVEGREKIYRNSVFYQFVEGKIVYICGTSSSGKSTLASKIFEKLPALTREKTLITGTDLFFDKVSIKQLRNTFGEKIEMVSDDIISTQLCFPKVTIFQKDEYPIFQSTEWKEWVKQQYFIDTPEIESLKRIVFKHEILEGLVKGNNFIIDAINFDFLKGLELNFIVADYRIVLLYRSPKKICQHMRSRCNMSIDSLTELRFFFPFHQYLDLYENDNFGPISLNRNDIESVSMREFFLAKINKSAFLFDTKKGLKKALDKYGKFESNCRSKLLEKWFHNDNNSIRLNPSFPYDLLIKQDSDIDEKIFGEICRYISKI